MAEVSGSRWVEPLSRMTSARQRMTGRFENWRRSLMPRFEINLQHNLQALGGGAYARVIIAGFFHHFIQAEVVVVGIVVVEDQLFRSALHHYIDGFAPVTVSPAAPAGGVVFRQILGIVDKHVGALGQLAHALVEGRVSRFVVSGVNEYAIFG